MSQGGIDVTSASDGVSMSYHVWHLLIYSRCINIAHDVNFAVDKILLITCTTSSVCSTFDSKLIQFH